MKFIALKWVVGIGLGGLVGLYAPAIVVAAVAIGSVDIIDAYRTEVEDIING